MKNWSTLKNLATLLAIVFLPISLCGDTLQVRYSSQSINSHDLREIFGHQLRECSVEGSKSLTPSIEAWGNVGYGKKRGHSVGLSNNTTLKLTPISAGLNWIFLPDGNFQPYVGAGVAYNQLITEDGSPADIQSRVKKWQLGAVVKSGIRYQFYEGFFINMFLDYAHQRFSFSSTDRLVSRNDVNLSGFKFGLGVGIQL